MGLAIDLGKCMECKRCMIACSLVKSGYVRMRSSRIEIVPNWPEVPAIRVCRFEDCEGHPCIEVCPVGAIRETQRVILVDDQICIGCGACVTACPYGAITIDDAKARKCDLCEGDPACVKECVTGAIQRRGVAT